MRPPVSRPCRALAAGSSVRPRRPRRPRTRLRTRELFSPMPPVKTSASSHSGLVTSLEWLDALVFTGGIGENSSLVRSLVLGRLGLLGLTEEPAANARHGRDTGGRISAQQAPVALVVPTDEELLIARDTARLIATEAASGRN